MTAPYFCLDSRAPGLHVLPRVLEAAAFRWQGASVNATYTRLVAAGSQLTERLADQMRREFKIPEKRVAYLRLIGLALSANTDAAWAEIERMAFAKRPPIPLDVSNSRINLRLLVTFEYVGKLLCLAGVCQGSRGRWPSAAGG